VFENRVLRRIFGPKRDEETGDRRKLHNVYAQGLGFSPSDMESPRHPSVTDGTKIVYIICTQYVLTI
jgi:hypothetical protein